MLYVFDNKEIEKQYLNLIWAFTTLTDTGSTRVYLVGDNHLFSLNDFVELNISGLESMFVEDFVSDYLSNEKLKNVYSDEKDFNIEFHSC